MKRKGSEIFKNVWALEFRLPPQHLEKTWDFLITPHMDSFVPFVFHMKSVSTAQK